MINDKRIIISMTSWPKRIENVSRVVFSLLQQTIKPDSIEINLSLEEFPNKERDLPNDLLLLQDNDVIKINWVEKNTKTFKKFIPVLQKYYGEDYYLFTVDDDWFYDSDYVECMLCALGEDFAYCPQYAIIGNRMVYRSVIFKDDFWNKLTDEVISTGVDDTYIFYYMKKHNIKMKLAFNDKIKNKIKSFNEVCPLREFYLKEGRTKKAEILSRRIW